MAIKVWTAGGSPSNDYSVAGNWSPSGVPVNADDVRIDGGVSNGDIAAGLAQSSVLLASFRVTDNYTGKIGTATAYLQLGGGPTTDIGVPSGRTPANGSQRIKIDFVSTNVTVNVYSTSSNTADTGLEPVRLQVEHSSSEVNVFDGTVGFGTTEETEAINIGTLNVNGGVCNVSAAATLATVNIQGGETTNRGADFTTLNQTGGIFTLLGDATLTTANVDDGTFFWWSDGTITTLNLAGIIDTNSDPRAKVITTANVYGSAIVNANTGAPLSVTFTNGIDLVRTGLDRGPTLNLGSNYSVALSAI